MVSASSPLVKHVDSGQKYINQYRVQGKIAQSEISIIKSAINKEDNQTYALKFYKKLQLKKLKEYHKRTDGIGMVVTDQLMKVMEHEVSTLKYIN